MYNSSYKIPSLDLASFSGVNKYIEAMRFLPKAFATISAKRINLYCTFHIYNKHGRLIGISNGDIIYPTNQGDIKRICSLLIALEDRRFYHHHGIDLKAIIRSFIKNCVSMRIIQGGSTITQQLVRNIFISCERSLIRKILEILIALKIEKHYTKLEILYMYCQYIYLGGKVRGFCSASKILYRKPLSDISNIQLCGLLGLLRLPSTTYPTNSVDKFYCRQNQISKILSQKLPTLNERELEYKINPIKIREIQRPRFSHIIEFILNEKTELINSKIAKVELTIDSSIQNVLDSVMRDISRGQNISGAAAIILDNNTGDVLGESSWQGGIESEFSHSFFGKIQPGSTFKTFALLGALEQGFNLDLTLESSHFISSFIKDKNNSYWSVRNYGDEYRDIITIREALVKSDNSVFARLSELLDLQALLQTYKKFKLCDNGADNYSIVIGGISQGVSLIKLAAAYRAIAQNGIYCKPRFIKYIQFHDDNKPLIFECYNKHRVADSKYINEIKRVLYRSGVSFNGTTFSGKTGTTKNGSLFAGYNENISLAIWLGFKNTPKEDDPKTKTSKYVLKKIIGKMLGYKSKVFSI